MMSISVAATGAAAGAAALGTATWVVSVTSLCAATHSLKVGEAPNATAGMAGPALDSPAAAARSTSMDGSAGR